VSRYLKQRPYPTPEPRSFNDWRNDLGLKCDGNCPTDTRLLTFDEFHLVPNVVFYRVADTSLYGFWRKYGNVWTENRTVKEWLDDYGQELVEPTDKELSELNLYLDWDGFMDWSAGIITDKESNKPSLLERLLNRLFSSQS